MKKSMENLVVSFYICRSYGRSKMVTVYKKASSLAKYMVSEMQLLLDHTVVQTPVWQCCSAEITQEEPTV